MMNKEFHFLIEKLEDHLTECCYEDDINLRKEAECKFEELLEDEEFEHLKETTLDIYDLIELDEWEDYYEECQYRSKHGTEKWLGLW